MIGEWQREWRGETGQFGRGGKETRKREVVIQRDIICTNSPAVKNT